MPSTATLDQLHEVIQVAMGWEQHHLHLFGKGDLEYGDNARDETSVTLASRNPGGRGPLPGAFRPSTDRGNTAQDPLNVGSGCMWAEGQEDSGGAGSSSGSWLRAGEGRGADGRVGGG